MSHCLHVRRAGAHTCAVWNSVARTDAMASERPGLRGNRMSGAPWSPVDVHAGRDAWPGQQSLGQVALASLLPCPPARRGASARGLDRSERYPTETPGGRVSTRNSANAREEAAGLGGGLWPAAGVVRPLAARRGDLRGGRRPKVSRHAFPATFRTRASERSRGAEISRVWLRE